MGKTSIKPKIKRSPNAYMIFVAEKHPEIKAAYPDIPFGEVGKLVGKMWREMSEADKQVYYEKSTILKNTIIEL